MPPSRRRSLFTLATSMIVFSAKAFNIVPLIPIAKSSLTEKTDVATHQVDPYLRLVEDCKLQAVNTVTEQLTKVYGLKEDDNAALESLSALAIMENQSTESMVSVIVNSLEDSLRSELSAIRMQLLDDFSSDDVCPLGALFMELPGQSISFGSKTNSISQEVMPPAFAIDDDIFTEASDSPADYKSNLSRDTNILSVNQLLDSILETATEVGRLSVSSTADVPFKEMASQCEALLVGKQRKLSVFTSARQQQEIFLSGLSQDDNRMKHSSHLCIGQLQTIGSPFDHEQNFNAYACTVTTTTTLLCPTEYQWQPQFRLPASSPFDNFLKAVGW